VPSVCPGAPVPLPPPPLLPPRPPLPHPPIRPSLPPFLAPSPLPPSPPCWQAPQPVPRTPSAAAPQLPPPVCHWRPLQPRQRPRACPWVTRVLGAHQGRSLGWPWGQSAPCLLGCRRPGPAGESPIAGRAPWERALGCPAHARGQGARHWPCSSSGFRAAPCSPGQRKGSRLLLPWQGPIHRQAPPLGRP